MIAKYRDVLKKPERNINDAVLNAEKKLAYLDSMEIVHQDILDQPAAFRYTIAFDTPTNFVYVIQAPDGRNLGVSKDLNKLPLNPEDNYFYILPSQ